MKLAGFLGYVLLAAPLGLAAQNTSYGVAGMESTTLVGPDGRAIAPAQTVTPPNLCPVSIEASHLSDGNIVRTGARYPKADHAGGPGQRLHLKLTSPDERTIDSATVNLRGWTTTGRAERLAQASANQDPTLQTRTLTAMGIYCTWSVPILKYIGDVGRYLAQSSQPRISSTRSDIEECFGSLPNLTGSRIWPDCL